MRCHTSPLWLLCAPLGCLVAEEHSHSRVTDAQLQLLCSAGGTALVLASTAQQAVCCEELQLLVALLQNVW